MYALAHLIEFFFIFQGTLPWQPIKVQKSVFFPDQSNFSLCHSETEWDNALYMHNLIASLMPLYRVKFW